ncbi:MAG: NAD(P)H-binding protein, partial [Bacteroidia bacterium]|nr:NAD(P)H-binding protein [Bacteroidia bacterium]
MKIFIVGGTGGTGRQLIEQALIEGHFVTALVRNPVKLKIVHPNLSVLKGNILKPTTFEQAIKENEVVISALGHKRFFIKTNILSEGTKNIVNAMEKNKVKRFICITSMGINDSRFRLGLYYTLFVIPVILLFYFLDKEKQERIIQQSTLDWTIVRPGQLTNGKKRATYRHGPK